MSLKAIASDFSFAYVAVEVGILTIFYAPESTSFELYILCTIYFDSNFQTK
jgi:hypothetical protein